MLNAEGEISPAHVRNVFTVGNNRPIIWSREVHASRATV